VLFNEPKLLKYRKQNESPIRRRSFSALQRAEIAEITRLPRAPQRRASVSVLFNEPKLLKLREMQGEIKNPVVSVLFNEPKLLKLRYR